MDRLTPERRSWLMGRVKSKDTRPEITVRALVFGMGYRYRLHRADLPGRPDLAFIGRKKAIFVNGCFWHRHEGCRYATIPKIRQEFWGEKFTRNVARDEEANLSLRLMGWSVMVIWQCELRDLNQVAARIHDFLEGD